MEGGQDREEIELTDVGRGGEEGEEVSGCRIAKYWEHLFLLSRTW